MGLTRAFVAIGLPDGPARALAGIAAACPDGHAVPEENLHLTLAFIGGVGDATLEEVHLAMDALRAAPVRLRIAGLGSFGTDGAMRALWAGVEAGPDLASLQKRIAQAARGAGADLPRRRFVPHVTLVRFRRGHPPSPALGRFIAAHAGLALSPFDARAMTLYASHLGRDGPSYEALADYPLR